MLSGGNDSEGEDMYGFLPKNKTDSKRSSLVERSGRVENIYETRKPTKVVTFKNEPPRVRIIQRRHSCAENFRNYQSYYRSPYVNRTPSYPPAIKRSTSFVEPCAHYHQRPLPPPPQMQMRPPPPSYNVAVRRAASFSATRGVNRGFPKQPQPALNTDVQSNLNRIHSSSTSELYVDSFSLKRAPSREILSAASSTSSISEATVYKKVGPGDYVSVSDKTFHRKSFRCETTTDHRLGPLIFVPVR